MTYKGLWPIAPWLLSNLCEAQYVDWTWHPVLKLLMIFPLWGVALPLTLQMAFFRSQRPLRMNHNIRHQRRRQQLHRRLSLLPLQLMNLVPLKDSIPPISPDQGLPDVAAPADSKESKGKASASAKKKLRNPIKGKAAKFHLSQRRRFHPLDLGQNLLLSRDDLAINRWTSRSVKSSNRFGTC